MTSPATYREVATVDALGHVTYTVTNAYTGNNARNALLANNGVIYMVGNAGNGANPQPNNIVNGIGLQWTTPGAAPAVIPMTAPGTFGAGSTEVGLFNIAQNGFSPDKLGKDSNFRGIALNGNQIFITKGSGGNGIDTVYQVGAGNALPTVPAIAAPTAGNSVASNNPISIAPGFNTTQATTSTTSFPFSMWFANSTTLYVTAEGPGKAETDAFAGLQKWSLVNGTWTLDYTLQGSLIGSSYKVANFGTVTTGGLRNFSGTVNPDGTVTIYAATATFDGVTNMDNGADPNEVSRSPTCLARPAWRNCPRRKTIRCSSVRPMARSIAASRRRRRRFRSRGRWGCSDWRWRR